jgi:N-acetylmuramoyl-L-alanine amidase
LNNSDRGQRARRLGAALLLLLLPALPLRARGKSEAWAANQYAAAQRLRETLDSLPSEQQTRNEYQRVITAYRRVYYSSPTSSKADPSVFAVAEVLTGMGRRFNDDKILHSAIAQYKFLRREYPGSRDRVNALFTIAQIYQNDLKDQAQAKLAFEDFLHHYPHNHLAEDARKALNEPVQQAALRTKDERGDIDSSDDSGHSKENAQPAHITSIHHTSNPEYTRVTIGLEKDIKFQAQRIDHPARIFFDLLNTNVSSPLLGKTFDVDDGLLTKIRVAQFQRGKSRIVLEVADGSDYTTFFLPDPPRLIIDVHNPDVQEKTAAQAGKTSDAPTASASGPPENKASAKEASNKPAPAASNGPKKTIVEADDDDNDVITVAKLDPPQIKSAAKAPATPALTLSSPAKLSSRNKRNAVVVFPDVHEASPTASGDRSLIRALGLKIGKIVIDPGHGGHDTGTIGPNGLEEKDLVLDVGRRLGKLLQSRMGADVVYTRKDDTFIPLETRTSIANQEQADLFVSIHANSSRDPDARGVETYYLNFTSSAEALDVAARENAASDKSVYELQDLVKKIALKEKIEESREFASNVQRALHSGLAAKSPGIRDRGVKKAPFVVLIGANMPSILAEISFVSNPGDERRLQAPEYRQRIAESLYRGISKYVSGLSGVKVASKIDKGESQ